ncbi:alpha/beta hydrolase [Paraburkholderia sp. BL25I1N1]|uniref:alpha/beta hydrolase n=1 Tax=Paraburkholderia sp. BL25I1N1 TaxID=1938804 RepID=UPI0035BE9B93
MKTARTTVAAWRDKPAWYIVSSDDRTINSELERFMAKRMHARTIEIQASHIVLVSHPAEVANFIIEAARQQSPSGSESRSNTK